MRRHAKATVVVLAMLLSLAFCTGASAAAPMVSIDPASEIGVTSAEATGEVNPEGKETSWHFEYATQADFSDAVPFGGGTLGESEPATPVSSPIEGLAPATAYHLRIVAENGDGASEAVAATFETDAATAPTLTALPASPVAYTTATISGEVDPEGGNVNSIGGPVPIFWQLQYALASEPGNWQLGEAGTIEGAEAESDPSAGNGIEVSANLAGLSPDTEYDFRLIANYAASLEALSGEESFETFAVAPPSVSADEASGVTATGAHFSGEVELADADPAFDASCAFDYIVQAKYEAEGNSFTGAASVPCEPNPVTGSESQPVEVQADPKLEPNTTYRLRLRAINAGGEATDEAPATFHTTAIAPTLGEPNVSRLAAGEVILAGYANAHNSAATDCHFDYGPSAAYGLSVPCESLPPTDNDAHRVRAGLSDLDPGAAYHLRLSVANGAGTAVSADVAFVPRASAAGGGCANAGAPGTGFLADCRAWEMVSPPEKEGGQAIGNTTRNRASADGSAFQFSSLQVFGDAIGSHNTTEYMAERSADPDPGDNGWSSHAITPRQESGTVNGNAANLEPYFQSSFSDDFQRGVFRALWPVPGAAGADPNVAEVANFYVRDDLRSPGDGSYALASPCPACSGPVKLQPSSPFDVDPLFTKTKAPPYFAGASQDFRHVLFESRLKLTADANGAKENLKAYEWDDGTLRLAGVLPGGEPAVRSRPGRGSVVGAGPVVSLHPSSSDGSRVAFTVPTAAGTGEGTGALYERIEGRTTIQLNASERAVSDTPSPAEYWDASADHSRVFFASSEALTEDADPDGGDKNLYMWKRATHSERQQLTLAASGGSFALSLATQPATARGNLTNGSATVKNVRQDSGELTGALSVGQEVSGAGISPGTTIAAMGEFGTTGNNGTSTLTLSAPATAGGSNVTLSAILNATTMPLPYGASAQQVEQALGALAPIGQGNVSVAGGPDGYEIEFTGDLAGVNMPQLTVDASTLTGTASVATADPVKNLTYLNLDREPADSANNLIGVIGASEDGSAVYFATQGQLVPGKRLGVDRALYLWRDGSVRFIAEAEVSTAALELFHGGQIALFLNQTQVTPDGRHLLFATFSGDGLLSERGGTDYDHQNKRQLYLYDADADTLECVSCDPAGTPASAESTARGRFNSGAAQNGIYLNHPLSDDGRYAFFTTGQALVPQDVNGRLDAYVYDAATGEPSLLSSGEGPFDSYFLDASAEGKDAFFVTTERLSGWDFDEAYDVYDARIGGGFPEPPAPPPGCLGDGCQPAPRELADSTPGSASLGGPGDLAERPGGVRCNRAARRAARLARLADRSSGPRARRLAGQAKRLRKQARRCRARTRANRRAAR